MQEHGFRIDREHGVKVSTRIPEARVMFSFKIQQQGIQVSNRILEDRVNVSYRIQKHGEKVSSIIQEHGAKCSVEYRNIEKMYPKE
jgi:hypothetical protein